jgi:hypothetical protein
MLRRIVRFVRELFSSDPPRGEWADDPREGGLGVREPRRPLRPSMSGGVALEAPPGERTDVRVIGEDDY